MRYGPRQTPHHHHHHHQDFNSFFSKKRNEEAKTIFQLIINHIKIAISVNITAIRLLSWRNRAAFIDIKDFYSSSWNKTDKTTLPDDQIPRLIFIPAFLRKDKSMSAFTIVKLQNKKVPSPLGINAFLHSNHLTSVKCTTYLLSETNQNKGNITKNIIQNLDCYHIS